MASAVEVTLIIIFIVLAILFVAALFLFLIDRSLFNWSWKHAKHEVKSNAYPCLVNADCIAQFDLPSNFVCDPHLKQCRTKSYIAATCSSSDDCLEITPNCITPATSSNKVCSKLPFKEFSLYGDPTVRPRCDDGLVVNPAWNFCQIAIGGPCTQTDDCGKGVCISGACTSLQPYDVCTEGSNYATDQCADKLYCASDPSFLPNPKRCQPVGIQPHQDGAYCATDADCTNKNCFKLHTEDPVGICESRIGLVGMACHGTQDCAPCLTCNLVNGSVTGTCVFLDPVSQTNEKSCLACQYAGIQASGKGCISGLNPVPCSSALTCKTSCNNAIPSLIFGRLNADQLWQQLYPQPNKNDVAGIFSTNFSLSSGKITLNPGTVILSSPFPSLSDQPFPVLLNQPQTGNTRGCQPLNTSEEIVSSYSNTTNDNVFFIVNYQPTIHIGNNGTITVIFASGRLNGGNPIIFDLRSDGILFTYFVQIPGTSTNYVYCNYHIQLSGSEAWSLSPGDSANQPSQWLGQIPRILAPPSLPIIDGNPDYLNKFLRMNPASYRPQIFAHFFYYASSGETVISSTFKSLPMQEGGGLATLVGVYVVDKTSSSQRSIVISTLSLFTAVKDVLKETTKFAIQDDATIASAVFPEIFFDLSTGLSIFCSVYSFTLIDFSNNWPFTATLLGPLSTQSDVSGLCNVDFTSTSQANATHTQLNDTTHNTIPGNSGEYPVFTPRAYTRIQAQSNIRTPDWTTQLLFGVSAPSLVDFDIIALGTAGSHSIVGLLLALSPGQQTLLLTMRFGDTITTSRYSIANLSGGAAIVSNPTRMYTLNLTADVEESGGGDVIIHVPTFPFSPVLAKPAFPSPQAELAPGDVSQVSVWESQPYKFTPPYPPIEFNACENEAGECIAHQVRTPWGIEVFTASLIPHLLSPPIRFFRSPSNNLSITGSDNYFVWGRSGKSIIFVPLFFDYRGIIRATNGTDVWISTAAESCPPTNVNQVILGMDHVYQLSDASGDRYTVPQWNLNSSVAFIDKLKGYLVDPLPLLGRMCETEGYQDGILYRARPYAFFNGSPGFDSALPPDVLNLIGSTTNVNLTDLQSLAAALSSKTGSSFPKIQDVVSLIGIGGIQAMLGTAGISQHPQIDNFFEDGVLEFVGYEGESATILPGAYRKSPCPANVRAFPLIANSQSTYPNVCPDFNIPIRKTLPIVIVYNNNGDKQILSYDLIVTKDSAQLVSKTTIQMNGGLVSAVGSLGGPVVIYSPCE